MKVNLIPLELQRRGIDNCFVYRGSSMMPTFREGQLLYVRPVRHWNVGDVVVFKMSDDIEAIVHRVVAITPDGLVTRGDHNKAFDPFFVLDVHVVGKVEMVEDGSALHTVAGGWRGLWEARIRQYIGQGEYAFKRLLWRPYAWLRSSHWVGRVWQPVVNQVKIQSAGKSLIKYVVGRRTVAVWDPSLCHFECKKPYDLVLFPPED
jgi:signal peptidase I